MDQSMSLSWDNEGVYIAACAYALARSTCMRRAWTLGAPDRIERSRHWFVINVVHLTSYN